MKVRPSERTRGRGAGVYAPRPRPRPRPHRPDCGPRRPHAEPELTRPHPRGLLRIVTDTDVRLWRRVHMDLVRYAGCVCHPSC
ncbi:putative leader peptide [Streptomyces formicae]